jgi:glycosyltransferase involved in cell wall biosynthesis
MDGMNESQRHTLSVVLPVYNEEGNIRKVLEELVDFFRRQETFEDYEIIAVDDGSTDKTPQILREAAAGSDRLKVITHPGNRCYGSALVSGLRDSRFDLFFFMDADGQFDIRDLEKLARHIDAYDIVIGVRGVRQDPFYRVLLGRAYNALLCLLFRLRLKDITCGFKLMKRSIFDAMALDCTGGSINVEILTKASEMGRSIKEVEVRHLPRRSGKQTGGNPKAFAVKLLDTFRLWFRLCGRRRLPASGGRLF